MMLLIKRFLRFNIPEKVNLATPTLPVAPNDPNQPRTRSGNVEVKPRVPTPTI